MDNDHTDPQLADYLNREPVVFMECTAPELMGSAVLAFVASLALAIAIGVISGTFIVGVAMWTLGGLGILVLLTRQIRRAKLNRPDNYYRERIHRVLNQYGLSRSPLIDQSRRYGLGRTRHKPSLRE